MEAFIKSDGKNIQAIYAHNDDMALGAIQALDEAGMNPGKDVTLISVDAVKAAFEAMVAGKLNATVECNPLMGPLVFDTINKVRAGEKVPKFIENKDQLFEMTNAAQVIGTREY
jgi:ABC-type sugar transport system substrate-binding protein